MEGKVKELKKNGKNTVRKSLVKCHLNLFSRQRKQLGEVMCCPTDTGKQLTRMEGKKCCH